MVPKNPLGDCWLIWEIVGYLFVVITFKKGLDFFQNWEGWDRISPEGKRGPPHKNGVTDKK
jgi:hypothetical protein